MVACVSLYVGVARLVSCATKTTIDDALIEHKFPKNVSRIVPYFFLDALLRALRNFYTFFAFTHPTPNDFKRVA